MLQRYKDEQKAIPFKELTSEDKAEFLSCSSIRVFFSFIFSFSKALTCDCKSKKFITLSPIKSFHAPLSLS